MPGKYRVAPEDVPVAGGALAGAGSAEAAGRALPGGSIGASASEEPSLPGAAELAAAAASQAAWTAFIGRYSDSMLLVAKSCGLDHDSARIVVDQALLDVWLYITDPGVDIRSEAGYVRAAVRNEAVRFTKKWRRERPASGDIIERGLDPTPSHVDAILTSDFYRFLREAIKGLSKQDQRVIRRYYWDGWTLEQIAAELGLPRPSDVYRLRARALGQLRERLKRELGDSDAWM